ncbi:uncharacterized protein LOC123215593 isoform X2 [Mangifera indica]|uniref:uncharacterized protein LOC123215593 isoform X2 n=1 Tax=Mangifera indica TaxID=29780 RepID=UPI001CFC2563|nr:uncharacterized protein LOC123215593 isoform X2 [Mangifera indica]
MAEYVAAPTCIKLYMQSTRAKERECLRKNSFLRPAQRRCSSGRCKVAQFSLQKMCVIRTSSAENQLVYPHPRECSFKCSCSGFLVNSDVATVSEWIPVGDQVLLMASIFLTYLAGVIPVQKSNHTLQKSILDNVVASENSTSPGSARKNDDKANLNYAWEVVKQKLLDSLDAIEHGINSGNRALEFEQQQEKHQLSLYAVSEGPKLRLLWASFLQLEKEVNNISSNPNSVNMDDWTTIFSEIIRESCQTVCMTWLENEFDLDNSNVDKALISLITEKLKGDDTVLKNIVKLGKRDLYAELVYFLRFDCPRKGCCYDKTLFSLYVDSILEDLVITLADGIASIYLELISVDGNLSNEINSLGLVMCNLSTRALQRLRNEVALNLWLYQNVKAVVSMYEDRFDLCTFQMHLIEESSRDIQLENHNWWKKLTWGKSGTSTSASSYIEIIQISISVRRTKELRALTGWRYYFSLFLELSDISLPFIRAVFEKLSNAISFFFVSLIGRSIGLIYTGIRQSLRWK